MNLFMIFFFLPAMLYSQVSLSTTTTSTTSDQGLASDFKTLNQKTLKNEKGSADLALESLSSFPPPGLAGQSPSMNRFKIPVGWNPDGKVLGKAFNRVHETGKFQLIIPPGETTQVRFRKEVPVFLGDKLLIYRLSSLRDNDKNRDSRYLLDVGSAEVIKQLSATRYKIRILAAQDAIESGDLIKKEWK